MIWWLVSRGIKLLPHFVRRPLDIFLLPIYVPLSFFLSLVRAHSLFTINRHEWLTRNVAMQGNRAVRASGWCFRWRRRRVIQGETDMLANADVQPISTPGLRWFGRLLTVAFLVAVVVLVFGRYVAFGRQELGSLFRRWGRDAYITQRYDAAVRNYNIASLIGGNRDTRALYNRGLAYQKANDHRAAVADFNASAADCAGRSARADRQSAQQQSAGQPRRNHP